MSGTYGELAIPVGITEPGGDPTLAKLGAFLRAVINADCGAAFDALKLHSSMATEVPVANVFTIDPRRYVFNDQDLPALFVYREESRHEWTDQDHRTATTTVKVMYLFPHDPYHQVADRLPFANAIVKVSDAALVQGRHPAWIDAGDTDPFAAAVVEDVDSIKLAVATSTSAQTYSGAALNGVIGGALMSPRREPMLVKSASAGTYAGQAVLTYVDWTGATRTASFPLHASNAETLRLGVDVKQVVSWALPAQNDTNGSFSFGTSANTVAGRGSQIQVRANLRDLDFMSAKPEQVNVEVLREDGERYEVRKYDAVEMSIRIVEEFVVDTSDPTEFYPINTLPHGLDLDVNQAGFTTSESLP